MSKQCCGKCKWLEVEMDKIGRRVVRDGHYYKCNAPYDRPPAGSINRPACEAASYFRFYMSGNSGENCPTFEHLPKIKKEKNAS